MPSEVREFIVTKDLEGLRLDVCISKIYEDLTRSRIKKLIKEGKVKVNEERKKEHYKVKEKEKIRIEIPEVIPLEIKPENIPLNIVYEDEYLVVLNKPAGMVVHPSAGHFEHTLVHALLFHCKDLSGVSGILRPGIVHRLDKDTSGLMIVAKKDFVHIELSNQLKERKVKKVYWAVVFGRVDKDQGEINFPLGRHPKDRKKFAVVKEGREAKTIFKVLERFKEATLLEVIPITGRTHQIRVHLSYIGHPILGDKTYANKKAKSLFSRQALHAKKISFLHPAKKEVLEFEVDLPEDMKSLIEELRKNI